MSVKLWQEGFPIPIWPDGHQLSSEMADVAEEAAVSKALLMKVQPAGEALAFLHNAAPWLSLQTQIRKEAKQARGKLDVLVIFFFFYFFIILHL